MNFGISYTPLAGGSTAEAIDGPLIDICLDFDCTFARMHWFDTMYSKPFVPIHLSPLKKLLAEIRSTSIPDSRRRNFISDHGRYDTDATLFPDLCTQVKGKYEKTHLTLDDARLAVVGDDTRLTLMIEFINNLEELAKRRGYQARFTILSNGFAADIALVLTLIVPQFEKITRIVSLRPSVSGYSRVVWTSAGKTAEGERIWESQHIPDQAFVTKLDEQRHTVLEMRKAGRVMKSILIDDTLPSPVPRGWSDLEYGRGQGDQHIAFFGVDTKMFPHCTGITKEHMDDFLKRFDEGILQTHWNPHSV